MSVVVDDSSKSIALGLVT